MRLGEWVRHFVIYGAGIVLLNVLPVALVPLYTRRIEPSEFGVLELLNRSQDLLLIILSLGLRIALLTFYQMQEDIRDRQKAVYSTGLQFLVVSGLIAVGVLWPATGKLSELLFKSRLYTTAVILIVFNTYFEMLFQMAVLYLQSRLQSFSYVAVFTSRLILALALNLVMVYWWRWGLMGILSAMLIHTSLFAVCVLCYVFRDTGFQWDGHLLKEMVRFGVPLVPAAFAGFILNNGDRYFLNVYGTRAEVGVYGLGYRIGNLTAVLVMTAFGKVFGAQMAEIAQKADGSRRLGNIATYSLAISVFVTLALSVLAPYAVRLLAPASYWGACQVVSVVGAAYVFYNWGAVMDTSFYVTKRTGFKPLVAGLSAGVILFLYWYLIPRYRMMGAAWATLGGFAAYAALTAVFSQRVYRIQYQLGRIAKLFALGWVLYEIAGLIPISPILTGVVGRSALTLAFPALLWIGGFFTQGERHALRGYWQVVRSRLGYT